MKLNRTDSHATRVRNRVLEAVKRVLGEDYQPGLRSLDLNSLKMLALVVALEQEFGIHISEDAPLGRITSSIDRIVEFLLTLNLSEEQR